MASRKSIDFGVWLDVMLSNRGITGRTLAEKAGVHDSAVSRWRSGSGKPSVEALAAIAEVLGVDPLRLAVTAGRVPEKVAGVPPLPAPEPTARRESVRDQLARIKGLTANDKQTLMETYEELTREGETA